MASDPAPACRACGSAETESFYRVPSVPVHSCLMVDDRATALAFPMGALDLHVCRACGFIQNARYDASLQGYSSAYEETQAFSPRFMQFLDELCDDQVARFGLDGKTLLEIGCGKGEYLVGLCERAPRARGIGIDPGYRPERTRSAAAERITFITDFFGPAFAHLSADYVSCRHTLEHIGEVAEFMALVLEGIGPRKDVEIFFELPDVERVLAEGAFWDIYYEHCSYFTAGSLMRLFRRTGFEPRRFWRAYDDQYLMLEARPAGGAASAPMDAEDDLARTLALVERFRTGVRDRIAGLRATVADAVAGGRRVAIWGSGSKAVSFLTTLGLGGEISAVVDINPHKHGKFLAGTGHEIVAPTALTDIRPDLVIAMNAIYLDEIGRDLAKLGVAAELIAI